MSQCYFILLMVELGFKEVKGLPQFSYLGRGRPRVGVCLFSRYLIHWKGCVLFDTSQADVASNPGVMCLDSSKYLTFLSLSALICQMGATTPSFVGWSGLAARCSKAQGFLKIVIVWLTAVSLASPICMAYSRCSIHTC